MVGLIGRKIGMTQVFDENGMAIPVSVIQAGPCPVVQVKTLEKDGYAAVQLAFEELAPSRANLPTIGHFKKADLPPHRHIQEFGIEDESAFEAGQLLDVRVFTGVSRVDVSGLSKGKGYQGVVKRHGFHGGKKTHGSSTHRIPGSIGMAAYPGKVLKGQRLPGRTGHRQVHMKNLTVVDVDVENNLLLVRGAVPGSRNTVLRLTASPGSES